MKLRNELLKVKIVEATDKSDWMMIAQGSSEAIHEIEAYINCAKAAVMETGKGVVTGSLETLNHLSALLRPAASIPAPQPTPFDVEAAKAGAPLVTRDGQPARFIAHVPEALPGSRVLAFAEGTVLHYYVNGLYVSEGSTAGERGFDLFLAPKVKRTLYLNVFADHSRPGGVAGSFHSTENSARAVAATASDPVLAVALSIGLDVDVQR